MSFAAETATVRTTDRKRKFKVGMEGGTQEGQKE
jgi:hypothetical protein